MLKEALEYLVSLRATAVSEIDGEHYSTDPLYRIELTQGKRSPITSRRSWTERSPMGLSW